jgi:hypothetical protein
VLRLHGLVVLRGDDHGVDLVRAATAVLDGDLALSIGAQEGHFTPPALGEPAGQAVRERDGKGHQFGRLVAGVPEHHSLIARALLLAPARVDAHGDLGRLLLDGDDHGAALRVEPHRAVGVADPLHGAPDDARVIGRRAAGDLAEQDHEAGLHRRLQRHPAHLVLRQALVEHGVGDLVADLVRVPLSDRFGAEECVP